VATLSDIDALVRPVIELSRPASTAERYSAINHGYGKGIRAVAAARPDYFRQEAMLTIPANILRILLFPGLPFLKPVLRINHIGVYRPGAPSLFGAGDIAGARDIIFERAGEQSDRFQNALRATAYEADRIYYDVIFESGVPVLALAPALKTETTALASSIYQPTLLTDSAPTLEPVFDNYQDMIVGYALAWLLRGVNDSEKKEWFDVAEQIKLEMLSHIGPATEQGTDHFDTGLSWDDI
jgi:hypothetical protein